MTWGRYPSATCHHSALRIAHFPSSICHFQPMAPLATFHYPLFTFHFLNGAPHSPLASAIHLCHAKPMPDPIGSLLVTDEPPDLGPGPRPGVLSEAALDARLATFFQQQKVPQPHHALLKALALL